MMASVKPKNHLHQFHCNEDGLVSVEFNGIEEETAAEFMMMKAEKPVTMHLQIVYTTLNIM